MKTDIFENMKELVGCKDVSDLPIENARYGKKSNDSHCLLSQRTVRKFSHYVFGVDYAVIMGILDMMKGSDRPCRKCESTC